MPSLLFWHFELLKSCKDCCITLFVCIIALVKRYPSNLVWNIYFAVIGIMPFDPTPTEMWLNKHWASCSLIGATSFSERLVRSRRTPQLMSKPTPPGDTTEFGSAISKAAMLPRKPKKRKNKQLQHGFEGYMQAYGLGSNLKHLKNVGGTCIKHFQNFLERQFLRFVKLSHLLYDVLLNTWL